jgi:hypothetical protein
MYGSTLPVTGPAVVVYAVVGLVLSAVSGVMFLGRKLLRQT